MADSIYALYYIIIAVYVNLVIVFVLLLYYFLSLYGTQGMILLADAYRIVIIVLHVLIRVCAIEVIWIIIVGTADGRCWWCRLGPSRMGFRAVCQVSCLLWTGGSGWNHVIFIAMYDLRLPSIYFYYYYYYYCYFLCYCLCYICYSY